MRYLILFFPPTRLLHLYAFHLCTRNVKKMNPYIRQNYLANLYNKVYDIITKLIYTWLLYFFTRTCLPSWVFLLSCFVTIFYHILCTLIGLLSHAIHKHSCRSQLISALTTCTLMFRQVCTIEPQVKQRRGCIVSRPFEGRQLVVFFKLVLNSFQLICGSGGHRKLFLKYIKLDLE